MLAFGFAPATEATVTAGPGSSGGALFSLSIVTRNGVKVGKGIAVRVVAAGNSASWGNSVICWAGKVGEGSGARVDTATSRLIRGVAAPIVVIRNVRLEARVQAGPVTTKIASRKIRDFG